MLALALACLMSTARAEEPAIEMSPLSDGTMQGRFVVAASPEEVRAMLADPVRSGRFAPQVVNVQVLSSKGSCDEIVTTTRLPGTTMDYHSMRCRTSSGIRDSLIDSSLMQDFSAAWDYHAVEGGTEVTVKIKSVVDLPVPAYVMRVSLQSSVKTTILNLISALNGN